MQSPTRKIPEKAYFQHHLPIKNNLLIHIIPIPPIPPILHIHIPLQEAIVPINQGTMINPRTLVENQAVLPLHQKTETVNIREAHHLLLIATVTEILKIPGVPIPLQIPNINPTMIIINMIARRETVVLDIIPIPNLLAILPVIMITNPCHILPITLLSPIIHLTQNMHPLIIHT